MYLIIKKQDLGTACCVVHIFFYISGTKNLFETNEIFCVIVYHILIILEFLDSCVWHIR